VDPVAGSTVSTVTASIPAMSSSRADGQAPRWMATRPLTTPAAPTIAASHSEYVTTSTDTWPTDSSHGGPAAGMTSGGRIQPPRTSDAAVMTRIATVIIAATAALRPRAPLIVPAALTLFLIRLRQ
jgi:hypothetical protein